MKCCTKCAFFHAFNQLAEVGECRRYAPKPVQQVEKHSAKSARPDERDAFWPIVCEGDWCGEFVAQASE